MATLTALCCDEATVVLCSRLRNLGFDVSWLYMDELRHGRIEPEALAFLGELVGGGLHRAMADPPDVAHVHEVERLGIAALEFHSERRLRSASLL